MWEFGGSLLEFREVIRGNLWKRKYKSTIVKQDEVKDFNNDVLMRTYINLLLNM